CSKRSNMTSAARTGSMTSTMPALGPTASCTDTPLSIDTAVSAATPQHPCTTAPPRRFAHTDSRPSMTTGPSTPNDSDADPRHRNYPDQPGSTHTCCLNQVDNYRFTP